MESNSSLVKFTSQRIIKKPLDTAYVGNSFDNIIKKLEIDRSKCNGEEGRQEDAAKCTKFIIALQVASQLDWWGSRATAFSKIAYEMAKEHFGELASNVFGLAVFCALLSGDFSNTVSELTKIASAMVKTGMDDEGIAVFKLAISIANSAGDTEGRCTTLVDENPAALELMGEVCDAPYYFEWVIKNARSEGNPTQRDSLISEISYFGMAKVGMFGPAVSLAETILDLSDQTSTFGRIISEMVSVGAAEQAGPLIASGLGLGLDMDEGPERERTLGFIAKIIARLPPAVDEKYQNRGTFFLGNELCPAVLTEPCGSSGRLDANRAYSKLV